MSSKGKLIFKGDKPEKKKKKRKAANIEEEDAKDEPQEGWVSVETAEDFKGPVLILSTATDTPSVLMSNEATSSVKFHPTSGTTSIPSYEPTSISEVFIAKKLPDSSKVTFRSAYDKYLGTDKFGVVACASEAISPAEEWEVVVRDDGIALQSSFDKFMRGEEDGVVRADSTEVGFREVFRVKCQAVNKSRAKKRKEKVQVNAEALEVDQIWGGGRLVMTNEDTAELRKAKKGGNLHEALLDRRAKLKSDKFCK
ncbi:hypothetical protein HK104_003330 [Borealophlyctis nickersoniae]|nr:hypothetical protein HK104_003330 [Borealophlyctis nickersoniae]